MIKIPIIQPIGMFYIGKMSALEILNHTVIQRRSEGKGVQRALKLDRVKKISKYCTDPDATFPTSIIISVEESKVKIVDDRELCFKEGEIIWNIIDGQHRLEGLKESNIAKEFELPVIFMVDLQREEEAYVFSVINSNQVKVPPSVVYDLFGIYETASPQKTAHQIARGLNSDSSSPFYQRLKMLGKKQQGIESLSQGTFIVYLLRLISREPDSDAIDIKNKKTLLDDERFPLRGYFIKGKDEVIYKIIKNYFSAVKNVFKEQWETPKDYILTKTTGYAALITAFPEIYKSGKKEKNLSEEYFTNIFLNVKNHFDNNEIRFTSKQFPSNSQGVKQLSDEILRGIRW